MPEITNEDLVLLATEVMGWRVLRDDDCANEAERIYKLDNSERFTLAEKGTHLYFGDGLYRKPKIWNPAADTPEGFWQAKLVAEAWCLETDGGWSLNWTARGRHVVDLYEVNEPDPIITKRADTLPLAITRAVLAAVKGES